MGNVRMRAEQINYGSTNVKVALDDLDPAALIELNNRMNRIDAWKATVKTEEKTGAEVTFTNALALAALSLSADIEPIQDLHGYDKPWVGGAGKNKLEYPYVTASSTINGVTFTVNSDGTVKANGTATANASFVLSNKQRLDKLASGTYIMNGCPTGGAPDGTTYFLGFYAPNKSAYDFGSGANISLSGNEDVSANIYIRIANGYTANNLVFKPMLRLSTETDPTFAPYSNICPISGHTSVTITRTDAESQTADFTIQLGQTVYGGTVNLVTGAARITYAIEDMGDLTWNYVSDIVGFYTDDLTSAMKKPTSNIVPLNGLCEAYPIVAREGIPYEALCANVNGRIVVHTALFGTNATVFTTAMDGVQLCYELAEPIELTLSPVAVEMLKGYNQISSDGGGDITVEAYTGAAWGGDE